MNTPELIDFLADIGHELEDVAYEYNPKNDTEIIDMDTADALVSNIEDIIASAKKLKRVADRVAKTSFEKTVGPRRGINSSREVNGRGTGIPKKAYATVKAQMINSMEEYELYKGDEVLTHQVKITPVENGYTITCLAYIGDHGDYLKGTDTVPDFTNEAVEIACDAIVEDLDYKIKKFIEDETRDTIKANLDPYSFRKIEVFYNSGSHKLFVDVVDANNYSHSTTAIIDDYSTSAIVEATDEVVQTLQNSL